MIDLILLVAVIGIFCAGFWAGKTHGSYSKMWEAFKAKF